MDTSTTVFYATGLPALISTGITFIYFFLKVGHYLFHAISHQTKGRVATATPGCGQHEHSTDPGEEGDMEVCKQISGRFSEQYGGGTQRSPGSIFVPRRRQNLHLPCYATEYSKKPVVREDAKRLQGRRHPNTKDNHGKEPSDPYVNSAGILTKCGIRENASDQQSSNDEGTGRKCDRERQHEVYDDGVLRRQTTGPANYTKTQKCK